MPWSHPRPACISSPMWLGEVMRCMYTWCRTGIPGMLRRWKLIAGVHTCHDFQPQWGHRRNSAAGALALLSCGSTACRASLRNYQMFSVDWWPNHHVLSVNPVNHVMCYRFPVAMDSQKGSCPVTKDTMCYRQRGWWVDPIQPWATPSFEKRLQRMVKASNS